MVDEIKAVDPTIEPKTQDVLELQGYLGDESRVPGVRATPGSGSHVPLYILGSSLFGAKLAAALGAHVTLFTTSPDKESDARRFGARNVVVNRDGADFSKYRHAFDFALDTVPYKHDLDRFIPLLKRDATYCRVGVGKVADSNEVAQMALVLYRNALAGSNTVAIRETQALSACLARTRIHPQILTIANASTITA